MGFVYQISNNIISPLGFSTYENYNAIKEGKTSLTKYDKSALNLAEDFCASIIDKTELEVQLKADNIQDIDNTFDKLIILSAHKAIQQAKINPASKDVLFILSTTKGNITAIDNVNNNCTNTSQAYLWKSANALCKHFGNDNQPIVISNACISGVSAIVVARRLLLAKQFKYVVIVGADLSSRFIISGFQSFKALSDEPCKPFDKDRKGLNSGEAAATIILSITDNKDELKEIIIIEGGAITNDANHISGPSRTGEGLVRAINKIKNSVPNFNPDFINAHGTATPYNDEMEAIAFGRTDLNGVYTNSLKGYFGHTMGAAGVIETVLCGEALIDNTLIKCLGFENLGTSVDINVIDKTVNHKSGLKQCLKTASGFGGCNAAVLISNMI